MHYLPITLTEQEQKDNNVTTYASNATRPGSM